MLPYLKTYWAPICLILLLAFGLSDTKDKLVESKKAHAADVQLFKDAQQLANTKAEEKRKQLEQEAKATAKQADVKYANLLANYRSNLVRLKAAQSSGSGPNYSYVQTPESSDGPREGSKLSITTEDADICAVNTARLQVVSEWANNLPKRE